MKVAALATIAAGIGRRAFLFAGGIYRLVDAKAAHSSIVGLVLIPFVVSALVWAGKQVWRGFGGADAEGASTERDASSFSRAHGPRLDSTS